MPPGASPLQLFRAISSSGVEGTGHYCEIRLDVSGSQSQAGKFMCRNLHLDGTGMFSNSGMDENILKPYINLIIQLIYHL